LPARINDRLFFENKIDGPDQKGKPHQVVPPEGFCLKKHKGEGGKHHQGDYFLYHFQLDQGEGASIVFIAHTVGRDLKQVFKKGNAPADHNNGKEWEVFAPFHVFEF